MDVYHCNNTHVRAFYYRYNDTYCYNYGVIHVSILYEDHYHICWIVGGTQIDIGLISSKDWIENIYMYNDELIIAWLTLLYCSSVQIYYIVMTRMAITTSMIGHRGV